MIVFPTSENLDIIDIFYLTILIKIMVNIKYSVMHAVCRRPFVDYSHLWFSIVLFLIVFFLAALGGIKNQCIPI